MKQYLSKSAAETKALGAKLAKEISHGVIALSGELGVGKTTFVQGFAKGLGIKGKIISPTFILIRQHQIPKTEKVLFHVDLYRLEEKSPVDSSSRDQFKNLGLEELLNDSNNVILIEWAERIEKYLPYKTIKIFMKKIGDNSRLITTE